MKQLKLTRLISGFLDAILPITIGFVFIAVFITILLGSLGVTIDSTDTVETVLAQELDPYVENGVGYLPFVTSSDRGHTYGWYLLEGDDAYVICPTTLATVELATNAVHMVCSK